MIEARIFDEMINERGEKGKTVNVNFEGNAYGLINEASNLINAVVWQIQKNIENDTKIGAVVKEAGEKAAQQILANVVGSFMQKSIDGEFDGKNSQKFIDAAWEFIDGNIEMNRDKEKLIDFLRDLLTDDKEPAAEPEPAEPAPEEAAEAEGGCSDNEQSV